MTVSFTAWKIFFFRSSVHAIVDFPNTSRVETKTVFSVFAKSENEQIFAKFREISFRENFCFRENFRFPGSFRENGYVSAINIFKMIH
jgi:hypothetical protein